MGVVVYTNGGDGYHGELESRPLGDWVTYGIQAGQSWMYVGYGPVGGANHRGLGKNPVIVFSKTQFSPAEKNMRNRNGFDITAEYELSKRSGTALRVSPPDSTGVQWPHLRF